MRRIARPPLVAVNSARVAILATLNRLGALDWLVSNLRNFRILDTRGGDPLEVGRLCALAR
jgi:hypothetical protein